VVKKISGMHNQTENKVRFNDTLGKGGPCLSKGHCTDPAQEKIVTLRPPTFWPVGMCTVNFWDMKEVFCLPVTGNKHTDCGTCTV
jgi:hypothetical protein